MNELENDDELLLLELERRDGIYSFIFHEMEDHQQQKPEEKEFKEEEQTLVETNPIENTDITVKLSKIERKLDVIMPSVSTPPANNKSQTNGCLFANDITKPLAYNGYNGTKTLNASDIWKTWQPTAAANTQILPFNFQFQMPITTYGSFKNPAMNKPWGVRKAKPSFSHVYAPLVRNRRHKLKETAEYKSFEENLTKVADLRHLFPLDPDVYAPFAKTKVEETKSAKACGVIVENINCLK